MESAFGVEHGDIEKGFGSAIGGAFRRVGAKMMGAKKFNNVSGGKHVANRAVDASSKAGPSYVGGKRSANAVHRAGAGYQGQRKAEGVRTFGRLNASSQPGRRIKSS